MRLFQIFKNRKFFLLNVFLTLYVAINLVGGERGLVSYLEKNKHQETLTIKKANLENKLTILENKNLLLSEKIDLDFLDILYREKLKFGTKDEIIIKLR